MSFFSKIPLASWAFWVGTVIVCIALPIFLTIINIANLIKKKKFHPAITDILTFVLGVGLTVLLFNMLDFKDYSMQNGYGVNTPIAFASMPTIITILAIGIISYSIIRMKKIKFPPLIIIAGMGGTLICSITMLIFIVQITSDLISNTSSFIPFFILFPLNYILCTIRAKREIIKMYGQDKEKENKKFSINDSSNWEILSVIAAVIIFVVMTVILTFFGQRADELINAFTQTKGWMLSIY